MSRANPPGAMSSGFWHRVNIGLPTGYRPASERPAPEATKGPCEYDFESSVDSDSGQ